MLWGDSHAAALSFGLRAELGNIAEITSGRCPPLFDLYIGQKPHCIDTNNYIKRILPETKPKFIILHAFWRYYKNIINIYDEEKFSIYLKNTINVINSLSPNSKIIIGGMPNWGRQLPDILSENYVFLNNTLRLPIRNKVYTSINSLDHILSEIAFDNEGVSFISPIKQICIDNSCPAIIKGKSSYVPTAWDGSHLTYDASLLYAHKIVNELRLK